MVEGVGVGVEEGEAPGGGVALREAGGVRVVEGEAVAEALCVVVGDGLGVPLGVPLAVTLGV